MKKPSESGKRIKDLRDALGLKQAEFADRLKVTQSMVSEWEAEKTFPSPEAYLRLGNLGSFPDNLWFWHQAGLDPQKMFSAAEQALKELRVPAKPGEVRPIARFRLTAEGREEVGPRLPIAAERVPNPLSTFCYILDEKTAGFTFSPGDVVAVDRSAGDVETCEPFWNQLVLAEFAPRAEQPAGLQGTWPEGFLIGKLLLERHGKWAPKGCGFEGRLGPLTKAFDARSFPIGYYYHEIPPDIDRSSYLPPRDREVAGRIEKEAREQALKNFRPAKGCRILGYVIAWFPAPPEKK